MALNVAEVLIRWRQEGNREVEAGAKRMGDALTSLGDKAKTAGAVMSAGLTAPLVLIGKQAVDAASDLNEATSAVQTVFGSTADEMIRFSRTAASQLGQSQQAALSAASAMGALFDGVGLTEDQMADFSQSLLTAAADLGSFYNVDPGQALQNLRSGLVGEAEPLRRFGILINEAAVETKALELGLIAAGDEMTEAQKVQARYALIMDQLGAASGDFARTSDGLANSQRILASQLQDVRAEIGQFLLPYMQRLVGIMGDALQRFRDLDERGKGLAVAIGAVSAAAGPALIILGQILSTVGKLGPVIGLLTGPLGLVVAGVAALALAFKTDFLGIRTALEPIIDGIGETLTRMARFFQAAKDRGLTPFRLAFRTLIVSLSERIGKDHPVVDFLQEVLRLGERLGAAISEGDVGKLVAELNRAGERLGTWFGEQFDKARTFGAQLLGTMVESLRGVNWDALGLAVRSGLGTAADWLGDVFAGIETFGAELVQTLARSFQGVNWDLVGNEVRAGINRAGETVDLNAEPGWQQMWDDLIANTQREIAALSQVDQWTNQQFLSANWGIPKATLQTRAIEMGHALWSNTMEELQNISNIGRWVAENFAASDFGQATQDFLGKGQELGGLLVAGSQSALATLQELSDWVLGNISQVDWTAPIELLKAHGSSLIGAAGENATGLLGGITAKFADVRAWFGNIGTAITEAMPDMTSVLYSYGADTIGGFFKGMQDIWLTVESWLGDRTRAVEEFLGLVEQAENTDAPRGGKDRNLSENQIDPLAGRAYGGPGTGRWTWVGEAGPELVKLPLGAMVVPHAASMSRFDMMGGMALGGTVGWGDWLRQQDPERREKLRRLRAAGLITARLRENLMAGRALDEGGRRFSEVFMGRTRPRRSRPMFGEGDDIVGNERPLRISDLEPGSPEWMRRMRRRIERNHAANSDALNRANNYGDVTGDYSRRDRVLRRELRSGALLDNGLSRQEREYIVNNYGPVHVYAADADVGRAIAEQYATRRR